MTTKDHILSVLKTHKAEFSGFGVQDVGLFGSYVRQQQTEESDIDLLIDFEPGKATFDNLMAFHELIENLFVGEKVEVVTKGGLSQHIGQKILKEVMYVCLKIQANT